MRLADMKRMGLERLRHNESLTKLPCTKYVSITTKMRRDVHNSRANSKYKLCPIIIKYQRPSLAAGVKLTQAHNTDDQWFIH